MFAALEPRLALDSIRTRMRYDLPVLKQPSRLVLTIWLAFVAFGTALAVLVPLGEGFDEPLHLAYVQRVAQAWDVPMGHTESISEEVVQFLENHPMSWGLHSSYSSLVSHDEYWREDSSVRESHDRRIRELRFSGQYVEANRPFSDQYERHQPPLFYLVTAPVFGIASQFLSFADTFLVLRLWSVLLASLTVPGAFFLARGLFDDRPYIKSILLLTILFPGLYPGVIRVANDALAVPLATWFLASLVHFLKTERHAYLITTSVLLAAGLWTKAFFIPLLIAALLTLLMFGYFRQGLTMLLIASIGGVWYLYNFMSTGSLTGLPETVDSGSSLSSSLSALWRLDWNNLAILTRGSHIWIGNWSFLSVRGWMYRLITWIFVVGIVGCLFSRRSGGSPRALIALTLNYAFFLGALIYYATQVFQNVGTSVAEGWYLTLLVPAEAVLFTAGIRSIFPRVWPMCVAVFGVFLLAMNIYANSFVMLPYYAGITSHADSGHLQTYHPSLADLMTIPDRLLRFYPWLPRAVPLLLILGFIIAALWLLITLASSRPAIAAKE